ncbi:efflux RND transporter periplasmic adaptor subunit [Mesorhizobium australicum]|uniref:Membrane fusion protein, multidrug efflux system n=1 Tax=Mesorhizobium australicum TaxID=536018 RepID=A0A1X7Q106_9HYPH|nr:efflux RND transporter periplasmic adaptor subunit [Mesorhizobium australicum]SMH57614.1 membrane fusion protein, multidrug efflux system [Mesorhizobium australicum]
MIKRLIIAIVLLVLVVGGIVGFNMFRDNAIQQFFANMPVVPSPVSTVKIEPAKWTPGIQAIGTVSASRGVDLTVETSGIVKDIKFASNQRVEQGALLVQLDDLQQQADLSAQRAQAALDKQNLDRAIELQKRGVGSETTVEQAQAAATASAAQVAKLEAVLEQKQLTAPFAGTMGIPRIDLGQYLTPGTTVATLQNLDVLRADFSVPEQSLNLVRIGQPVRFGVNDADMPFRGAIVGIEPKVDPSTRLVLIRAEIANPEGKLAPGQFVQVRVDLPEEDNVIAVPQTAVVTSLYGDFVYAVRPADAKPAAAPAKEGDAKPAAETPAPTPAQAAPSLVAQQIFVKLGRRSDGRVEIVEGLKDGDEIVTAGQNRLSNGGPVVVDNTVQPQPSGDAQADAK